MAKRKRDRPLKIDMDFEDALRLILKAKPVHKKKTKSVRKKAAKHR